MAGRRKLGVRPGITPVIAIVVLLRPEADLLQPVDSEPQWSERDVTPESSGVGNPRLQDTDSGKVRVSEPPTSVFPVVSGEVK